MDIDFDKIPKGVWLRREGDIVIIGSERQPISGKNLVPIFIALGMISVLILAIIKFDWVLFLIGLITTFIGGSILIAEFGAIEFRLGKEKGKFFQGIGKIGFTYSLVYKNITAFFLVKKTFGADLKIKGKKEKDYGVNVDNTNLLFIVEILNEFIKNPSVIRNQLISDLSRHLVK